MTARKFYREPVPRCQALTSKGKRCSRDATAMHNGKGYCNNHHGVEVVKTVNAKPLTFWEKHGYDEIEIDGKKVKVSKPLPKKYLNTTGHPDPDTETLI